MKTFLPLLLCIGLLTLSCNQPKKEIVKDSEVNEIEPEVPLEAPKTFVHGIDISHYQGDQVDFFKKHEDNLSFIICKATEGITYTDPDFSNNWKMIKEKSFIRGAYHFYRTNDDPRAQAANYLGTVSGFESTDIPPIVDFEEGGISNGQSIAEIQAGLMTFLKEIENKTTLTPIIYTDVNTGNKYLNDPVFSTYPLWIANYTEGDSPDLPTAWKNRPWLLWQRSDSYTIGSTKDDFDVFNGSRRDLKIFMLKSTSE